MPHRLIVIPQSHFCEKARWTLERAGIPFVEEPHAPLFQIPHAWWAGRRRTVPVLVLEDGTVLNDSGDILSYAERFAAEPLLAPLDEDAKAWLGRLDDRFGPHTRRLSYAAILPQVEQLRASLLASLPWVERMLLAHSLPLARFALTRLLAITPASVERSRSIVAELLDEAERRRAGRSFLAGEAFSALDLTFCALLAPLIAPPEYGGSVPAYDALPSGWRAEVDRYRATPAGAWALDVYARERPRVAAAVA